MELIDSVLWTEPFPDLLAGITTDDLGRFYAEFYLSGDTQHEDCDENQWVWDLMYHLCQQAPLIALDCVVSSIRQPLTQFQASCVAAGALEDIIADHGSVVIERVEALSQASARFRYVLSGVWPRGQDPEGDIWKRVLQARAIGPDMDKDDAMPAIDL